MCGTHCDPGTNIVIKTHQDGVLVEDVTLCCRACMWDYFERELIDDRVAKARRSELMWMHERVCPACKERLKECIAQGDVPEATS